MLAEVTAATDFLTTLFSSPSSIENREQFVKSLSERLFDRFTDNWFEHDGERGSASRAIVWHGHGGGEGCDPDLLAICRRTVCSDDRVAISTVFALPFTLWIDPGCVAVRLGHGPGVYTTGMTVTQHHAASSIKVIYGAIPSPPAAISPTAILQPPTLALLPSTPALGGETEDKPDNGTWNNAPLSYGHGHSMSARTVSSGGCSVLTVGSRVSSGAMTAMTDDDACPSLAAPSSTRGDSESDLEGSCYDDDEDDGDSSSQLSIQDMMERIGFCNIDIIDDDEDEDASFEDDDADQTIRLTDTAVQMTRTPSTTNVTNYDGGNVGVMGGGVRLGGAARKLSASPLRSKPRSAMEWPTDALTGLHNLPLPSSRPAQWSKPVGLSPISSPLAGHQIVSKGQGDSGYGNVSGLSFAVIDGNLVAIPATGVNAMDNKRGRSRGRRSRGRGAGRAARRQAAAMLKQQLQQHAADEHGWHHPGAFVDNKLRQPAAAVALHNDPMRMYAAQQSFRSAPVYHNNHFQHASPPTMMHQRTNVNPYVQVGNMAVMPSQQWQARSFY